MRLRSAVSFHSPGTILALAALLSIAAPPLHASSARTFSSRICGTQDPTPDEAAQVQAVLEAKSSSLGGLNSNLGCVVPVAFHVITNGTQGNVTDQQIAEQIDEMNLDYSGSYGGYDTGYRFVLSSIDRTNNATWFTVVMDSNNQKRLEEALGVDPTHHLNIYTADIDALGWSSLPWGNPEGDIHQGVFVHYQSLPGGNLEEFNLGRTATHETGHYFGLFHTFFGGCSEPNDFVADTPQEAEAASGCPPDNLDTCPSAGMDPIHDYLDYSDDPCYDGFTAGQDARMDQTIVAYRPSLLPQPVAVRAPVTIPGAPSLSAAPNPASGPATVAFRLQAQGQIRLSIVDVAGRTVASLADGIFPAGRFERVFDPGSRANGVYFAVLSTASTRITRPLVIAR
jgi:hypothetical protein